MNKKKSKQLKYIFREQLLLEYFLNIYFEKK